MLKEPEWTWEVPWYLFAGGLAGASAGLAFGARLTGRPGLASVARLVWTAGAVASPTLLVIDLGRPSRFVNMLRVFKPTSAMSMGSWLLTAFVPVAVGVGALGAALVVAGGICQHWGVFRAGFASARDPRYVVGPQRRRRDTRAG